MGLTWDEFAAHVSLLDKKKASFVRMWHPNGPGHWTGDCSECDVDKGAPAYQLSNGQIVAI